MNELVFELSLNKVTLVGLESKKRVYEPGGRARG